ncbi:uncharacterized protein LOC125315328 [Rhodamnia argentea]|uniref:Uncharacterized protein LOC125315328 n=1 Tax=Rhodamnia argentea TaxID=178133 RepID=A0ABM3HGK1_9MYRT|nr:uncharacterized protein LOC125315328 [Rhodamnia argentea]
MSIDPAIPVASFAWDVLKWVVVPVKRQFGYVISSKSYAQDLWKEVGKLTYEAERIHNAVEVARNNIRTVYSLVTDWHESAEKALKEARELLEEFEKASKSCCYGTLPDPNCRYQFSRKAKDKIELLQRLARECSEFRDISSIDPAPGNVTAPTSDSDLTIFSGCIPKSTRAKIGFIRTDGDMSLTNLEKLVLCESHLEKLSRNVEAVEDPSHELLPSSRYFQHLKTLDVSHCDGLSSMFTPTMAKNLAELIELRIRNCKMLKEVISDDGGKEGYAVTFNQLKHIQLDGLTRLSCFSSSEYTLVFPLLEDVMVSGCPNMQSFSKGPIVAPKLERIQVETQADPKPQHEVWFWKENLNTTIQNMFEEMATIARVKFMWLSEFPKLIGKWHSELNPIKSSWQLERLAVDNCPSFVNAIPSKLMLVLEKMTTLQVCNCESLEEIFDLEGLELVEISRVLPQLQDLGLVNLPKLRQLWNKDLQGTMRFSSLFSLTLYNCSNLIYAFTPSMAQCLANLREIEIKECGEMEEVIAEEEGHVSVVEKITFPMLYMMTLECLPNLTSFLSGKNHTLDCPSLTVLTIAHCPEMRSLTWHSWMQVDQDTPSLFTPQVQFPMLKSIVLSHMDKLSKIWTCGPQGTFTFKYLQKVEAQNCKNLEILFPHWVATSLTQLEELRVESCGPEEIVSSASGDDSPHSIAAQFLFPVLTSPVLHDMPQLKSFCPNLLTLHRPFLKELRVTHCEKMNMLSFPVQKDIPTLERHLLVDKDIQRIQNEIFFDDIDKREALTLACFHDERAGFPSNILLQIFPNLKSLEVFRSSFEDIFPDGGLVDEGKHPVLENLKELKLNKLHNLKRVRKEDYLITKVLQSIDKFEVCDCPGLTTLFPVVTSFRNLTELVVKSSSGLVHLLTVSAVANLVHLTDMTIIECERMREVVANDENGEGKVISFGMLKWLTLQDPQSLECFCSTTSCILRFPSLIGIVVEECPKMKIFSNGTLSTPQLRYRGLLGYELDENRDGDLNTAIQKLSA